MSVFKHALAARDAHIRTLAYCPGRVIPAGNRHGIRLVQRSPPAYGLLTASQRPWVPPATVYAFAFTVSR